MTKSIWRSCKSKTRYRDEHTVNDYKKKCERARGKKLDYYWCPYCRGFHLTSKVAEDSYLFYEWKDETAEVMIS
ncbi:MAG: hypothetical protein K6G62_04340 [Eubacterium sp.]|nr:hypothetical protein [Eubacterium sp.]